MVCVVMVRARVTALSITLTGDTPPSEFRIFTSGEVDTVKGKFIFDALSAKQVMAEYRAHGIDLMVDYDHAALGGTGADPALASRAAGWFELEVRNGELWAVNVRWTPPAHEALSRKEWRFMSPAFEVRDGRIVSLMNVALTNLPATRRLEALMPASITALGVNAMDPELAKKALDVVTQADGDAALALLADILAAAAGGEAPSSEPTDAPVEEPVEELADPPAPAPAKDDEDKETVAASIASMLRMTGATSMLNLSERVTKLVALEAEHEKNVAALAKERATLELAKRKENAVTLTKLGAETPATTGLAKGKLCKRLLDEPLDEQNARVAALLASRGGKLPETPKTPTAEVVELSDREVALCKEKGLTPAQYLANKNKLLRKA